MNPNHLKTLSIFLKIKDASTTKIEKDGLGRHIHFITVENHKNIKKIKMMTDSRDENVLRIFNDDLDKDEILWEQKALYNLETKFLIIDYIEKIKKENITFSIEENHEDSPYRVKVSFHHSNPEYFHNLKNDLSILSESSKLQFLPINLSLHEFEAVPKNPLHLMLYESELGISDVFNHLVKSGFTSNE